MGTLLSNARIKWRKKEEREAGTVFLTWVSLTLALQFLEIAIKPRVEIKSLCIDP